MTALHTARIDDVAPLAVFGSEFRILLTAAQSGGALGVFEERDQPGGGPPLHVHHDADETFLVEEGRYRFRWQDREIEGGPGTLVFIPRGTPHTFMNVGDGPGRFRCMMTPGGFEGFFPALVERGTSPGDMDTVIALGREFHLDFVGPNPFAPGG